MDKIKKKLKNVRPDVYDVDTDLPSIFNDEQLVHIHHALSDPSNPNEDGGYSVVSVEIGRPGGPISGKAEDGMSEMTAITVSAMALGYSRICIVDDPRYKECDNGSWPQIDMDINAFITCAKKPMEHRFKFKNVFFKHICLSYTSREWKEALTVAIKCKIEEKFTGERCVLVFSCALSDLNEVNAVKSFLNLEESKCVVIFRNYLRCSVWSSLSDHICQNNKQAARELFQNVGIPVSLLQNEHSTYRKSMKVFFNLVKEKQLPLFMIRCPWLITPCEFMLSKNWPIEYCTEIKAVDRGQAPVYSPQKIISWDIPLKRCEGCLRFPTSNITLKKCGRCFSVYYCGINCQKRDWSNHKKKCKKINI